MKALKDVDLSLLPAPLAAFIRDTIPENAIVDAGETDTDTTSAIILNISSGDVFITDGVTEKSADDTPTYKIDPRFDPRKPYLNRKGERFYNVPDPADYVKDVENLIVEGCHAVQLYAHEGDPLAKEVFRDLPTAEQIKWAILKHKADYATVRQEYSLTM